MRRRLVFLAACLALVVLVFAAQPTINHAQDESPQPLAKFMQLKLDYAKEILAGLTTNDHEKVAKNAEALRLLSLESTWNAISTEEYLDHSRDFRSSAKAILNAAKEKNIERATLGYVTMTVGCVECHRYIRDQK